MRKGSAPTLGEVAKRAEVSTTTASRVINGGARVDPQTLERVQRVIEELGYTPNQAARVLKGDRTRTIGLLIPSIADPFFSSLAEAAQVVVRANDSLLMVATSQNEPQIEVESLKVLIQHRVDGVILAPANSKSQILANMLNRLSIPLVALDRPVDNSQVSSVVTDNFSASRDAVTHLIEHGYKRIVCLTGESTIYTIQERMRGYQEALKAASLPILLDTSIRDYRSAEHAIEGLLKSGKAPDALFTLKNSTTVFAFEALQKFGIDIPRQVALLGFDDFELAATLRPSISVVRQPVEEIGRAAAELLFEQYIVDPLRNKQRKFTPRQLVLESRIIRRSSCGCT